MARVLALDPGSVRVGVAVSDPLGITAQPHSSLLVGDRLLSEIVDLVGSLEVDQIVVGLPVSLDGGDGRAAVSARAFADQVATATGIDVDLVDERFSSVIADRVMIESGASRSERRQARDRVAAAVILQAYLDGRQ